MDTIIRTMKGEDLEIAEEASRVWHRGGLVAFPTETVYGLGGNGLDVSAAEKIYAAKCRPSDNPLILHIAERSQLESIVAEITPQAEALMDAFWPGPLTMIFPKAPCVPLETTGGLNTVAVRMPSHPMARCLLKACGLPIAAPSANRSGRPSPTRASHVIEDMEGRIDMIIDGGEVGIGVESTIIDLTGERPTLLRPGFITVEDMERVLGPVAFDAAVFRPVSGDVHPKAPGMKYRHYAPKAEMTIVKGEPEAVVAYINAEIQKHPEKRFGVLASHENASRYENCQVEDVGSRDNLAMIAHNLFDVLRVFDAMGVDAIWSECFSDAGEGMAVMNRLMKAAGHHVITV